MTEVELHRVPRLRRRAGRGPGDHVRVELTEGTGHGPASSSRSPAATPPNATPRPRCGGAAPWAIWRRWPPSGRWHSRQCDRGGGRSRSRIAASTASSASSGVNNRGAIDAPAAGVRRAQLSISSVRPHASPPRALRHGGPRCSQPQDRRLSERDRALDPSGRPLVGDRAHGGPRFAAQIADRRAVGQRRRPVGDQSTDGFEPVVAGEQRLHLLGQHGRGPMQIGGRDRAMRSYRIGEVVEADPDRNQIEVLVLVDQPQQLRRRRVRRWATAAWRCSTRCSRAKAKSLAATSYGR